jgi:hypothetical protein
MTWCAKSASRKSLKGLGVFPLSTDRFINGPTHGPAGRYFFFCTVGVSPAVVAASYRHIVRGSASSRDTLLN